jgi:hypothetical protein
MGRMRKLLIPGVDKNLLVKDALKQMPDLSRRRFIAGGASLGALTLLTGCDVTDSFSAESMLTQISKFNDAVQARLFNPNTLAPTFPARSAAVSVQCLLRSTMRRPSTARTGSLKCAALSRTRNRGRSMKLINCRRKANHAAHLRRGLERDRKLDRHAAAAFPQLIGADMRAKYVWFNCADYDGYNSPLDMASALHPQTQMTFKFDNEILPRAYGYPMKIRVPTKLGFKNEIRGLSGSHQRLQGRLLGDMGYNSFSGS